MEQSLTKAVDALATQLKEKDALLHSLQAQLSAKESYISQLHQVIVATGGSAPAAAPATSTASVAPAAAAAAAATKGLSKNQLKKQKKQQKQAEPATSAPVTPLKEQPAPAPEAVPAATPTTPESAKNKRKRDATKAEATTPTKKDAAASPAKKTTPKKDTPKKAEAKAEIPPKSPGKDSKNVKVLKGGLKLEDTKLGSGKVATLGKRVSVLYKGFLTNGKSFDSSLNKPFTFRLGVGEVIKGWDTGVAGMKVGGRRKLVIPPTMGYGRQSMPGIPGNSTLLFEVELVDVK